MKKKRGITWDQMTQEQFNKMETHHPLTYPIGECWFIREDHEEVNTAEFIGNSLALAHYETLQEFNRCKKLYNEDVAVTDFYVTDMRMDHKHWRIQGYRAAYTPFPRKIP